MSPIDKSDARTACIIYADMDTRVSGVSAEASMPTSTDSVTGESNALSASTPYTQYEYVSMPGKSPGLPAFLSKSQESTSPAFFILLSAGSMAESKNRLLVRWIFLPDAKLNTNLYFAVRAVPSSSSSTTSSVSTSSRSDSFIAYMLSENFPIFSVIV